MPLTIRQQLAPEWFKLYNDDPQSPQFYIRPLNQLQFTDLKKEIGFNSFDRLVITSAGIRTALEYGLLDWRGIVDEHGADIKCTRDNQTMLPEPVLVELAFEIGNRSRLTDEQKKSSSSPLT